MLLRKSKSVEIILNGFLRDEPRVKAVVILADEDNKNYHSVRTYWTFSLRILFDIFYSINVSYFLSLKIVLPDSI